MRQVRDRGLHEQVQDPGRRDPAEVGGHGQVHARQRGRPERAGLTTSSAWKAAKDKAAEGIKICVEQIQQLRQIEGVAGIHLMAIEWEKFVPQIVQEAGLLPRPVFN